MRETTPDMTTRDRFPSRLSIARHLADDHDSPDLGESYASLMATHDTSHPYPAGGELWWTDHAVQPQDRHNAWHQSIRESAPVLPGDHDAPDDCELAKHPLLTIDAHGDFGCTCGNTPDRDGFYTTYDAGDGVAREVEPIVGGIWDGVSYSCAKCGATYRVTGTGPARIVGMRRRFEPIP